MGTSEDEGTGITDSRITLGAMTLPDWPALHGATPEPQPITCEHAVWGKVQGAGAALRWIARSPGFDAGADPIAAMLGVGDEDRATGFSGWRALPRRYLATGFYPGRARDPAGRPGMLERQILEWRPGATGIPPALAALILLPTVAGLDDGVWWGRRHLARWDTPDFALPLPQEQCPDLDPQHIGEAIARGIDELAARLTPARLRDLYAQILAGQRPAQLPMPDGPLGPAALAALLLPLPAPTAGRISLVGWVPTQHFDLADLVGNWDLIVTAQGPAQPGPAIDQSHLERAERMAAALLGRDPELLADAPADGDAPPLAAPPKKSRRSSADPLFTALAQFTADPNRRLLDLAELARAFPLARYPMRMREGPGAHALCQWVSRVATGRPEWADARGWDMKVDQLRAAALFLLPHPQTLALVGLPQSPHVPALLLALACHPKRVRASLGDHGDEGLRRILSQSLACPREPVRGRIRAWLIHWQGIVGAGTPLGVLIGECLASAG